MFQTEDECQDHNFKPTVGKIISTRDIYTFLWPDNNVGEHTDILMFCSQVTYFLFEQSILYAYM